MRSFGVCTLVLLAFTTNAPASQRSPETRRLDVALKLLLQSQSLAAASQAIRAPQSISRRDAAEIARNLSAAAATSSLLLVVRFTGDERQLADAGLDIQARVGSVYSGTLAADRLGELAALPGMVFIEPSKILRSFTEEVTYAASTAVPAGGQPGSPISSALTSGSGVVIAFIDSGVDIRHLDFRRPDGSTRIKFLLDLSDPGDVDGDGKLDGSDDSGGTLYTEDEINRILKSSVPPKVRDTTGHGTHGLSVAAGDDPELPGIAPGAALIVVKATRRDGSLEFESADIVNALAFVDRKAAELRLPYVVNLSLGSSYGPHDGKTAEELAIDTLVGPGIAGKAVVVAAGNSAGQGPGQFLHFQGTALTGFATHHTLTIPSYPAPKPGIANDIALLNIWYQGEDRLTVRVIAPDGATTVEAKYGGFADETTPFGQVFIGNMGGRDPRNGDTEAVVLLYDKSKDAPAAGNWIITLVAEEVTSNGVYHGWLIDGASSVGGAEPYLSANADDRFLIARPAGAEHCISVGSFARHDPTSRFRTSWRDVRGTARVDPTAGAEEISTFSSPGPTRDGRLKPDIAAPGEQVIGAVSRHAYPGTAPHSIFMQHPFPEPDALIVTRSPERTFGLMQGTSVSAPVVTGLVARLLAINPKLDAIQVRNILLNSSRQDGFTGDVPNAHWGYGKADLGLASQPKAGLPSPFRIANAALSSGVVGEQYNELLMASGGTPPFDWDIVHGALPPGIDLLSDELITGTPLNSGTYEVTLRVVDSSAVRQSATAVFRILITEAATLEITTANLPPGDVKRSYLATLKARGGTAPYSWTLSHGALPAGLALAPDGSLAGGPLVTGRFPLTASVSDMAGDTALRSLRLDVGDSSKVAWQPVGSDDQYVRELTIDPNDPNHLVAGVSTLARRHSVYQSFDAGRTWREISLHTGLPFDWVASLGIDPATSDLWALPYVSRLPYRYNPAKNEWLLWTQCHGPFGSNHSRAVDMQFDAQGSIFVLPYYMDCPLLPGLSAFRGFIRSNDSGNAWQNIGLFPSRGAPDFTGNEQLGGLSVFHADSRYLYASHNKDWSCCAEPIQEGFFRSIDGGMTWTELPVNIETVSRPYVSQTNPLDIIRGPWNPDEYSYNPWRNDYAGTPRLERSSDGGTTWNTQTIPSGRRLCRLERAESLPSLLLAGTSHGLFISRDHGMSWVNTPIAGTNPNFCEGGALAIDPTNPQALYIGLRNSRVATSKDGGVSWKIGGEGLLRRRTSGMALSSTRPTDLLLLSGAPFVTRTSGKRWTLSAEGVTSTSLKEGNQFPIISKANPDLFFFVAANDRDLYRSTNRGISWTPLHPVFGKPTTIDPLDSYQPGIVSLVADPFDADILIARVHFFERKGGKLTQFESMWRSLDRGTTWREIPEPAPSASYPDGLAPSLAFAGDKPGHLYALGPEWLYESWNNGDSWVALAPLRTRGGVFPNYRLIVKPAPSDSRHVYVIANEFVGAYDVAMSTWEWTDYPQSARFSSIAVDAKNPQVAYLGRRYSTFADFPLNANNDTGGIDKTIDGGRRWTRLHAFPKSLSVVALEVDPKTSGLLYAATLEDGVYRSSDGGTTWEKMNNYGVLADVVNVAVTDPTNRNLLYVGTQGFGVQVSTNGGQSFVPRIRGLTNLNVTSLAFDSGSPQIIYAGTEGGLFRSTDSGASWTPTAFAGGIVTDISVDEGSRPRRVRITTFLHGVGTSRDEGRSFTYRTAGLGSLHLTGIESQRLGNERRLWLTMHGGNRVMLSDDLGVTWKLAAGIGLTAKNINDVAIDAVTGRVWMATEDGVFWTENAGASWSELSTGLPHSVSTTSLSVHPESGELLVSLSDEQNGGVYRGGNLTGSWSSFNEGLADLRVKKLTNDGGHPVGNGGRAATFWASTAGSGLYSVDVNVGDATPKIANTSLPGGRVGETYRQILKGTAGTAPYVWSVIRGDLPQGLGLESATGRITGVPPTEGTYRFTVLVVDALSRSALRELDITIHPPSTAVLRVTKAGNGTGVVSSDPPGIHCGTDCGEIWSRGVRVRLTAVAAPGSIFAGWSEPSCKAATCAVTLHYSDRALTASFRKVKAR